MDFKPHFGDIPGWVASLGTVGALMVAFFQINTDRRRRHEDEEKARAELRLAQARLISAVMGPEQLTENSPMHGKYPKGRTAVELINGSAEPVYQLVIGIVYIQGTGPRTLEEMFKLQYTKGREARLAVTTASILPGGTYRVWIHGTGWSRIRAGRFGSEVAFTDRAGNNWIRRS